MDDIVEINVEAKKLHELLLAKRCARHARKDKKAKRAKLKQQLRKDLGDCGP